MVRVVDLKGTFDRLKTSQRVVLVCAALVLVLALAGGVIRGLEQLGAIPATPGQTSQAPAQPTQSGSSSAALSRETPSPTLARTTDVRRRPQLPPDVMEDLRLNGEGTSWYPHIKGVEWRKTGGGVDILVAMTDLSAKPVNRGPAEKACMMMSTYALNDEGDLWPVMVLGARGEQLVLRSDVSQPCKAAF